MPPQGEFRSLFNPATIPLIEWLSNWVRWDDSEKKYEDN